MVYSRGPESLAILAAQEKGIVYMQRNTAASWTDPATLELRSGKLHVLRRIACDCEWYDKYGNRLGFVGLDTTDLKHIAAELGPNDIFVAVEDPDACLRPSDAMRKTPSLESLVEHSFYVMTEGRVCRVIDKPSGITVLDGNLLLWPITRAVLRRRLLASRQ